MTVGDHEILRSHLRNQARHLRSVVLGAAMLAFLLGLLVGVTCVPF